MKQLLFGLVVAVLLSQACRNESGPARPESPEADVSVELRPVTFQEWQERLDSLAGRIVVVDFWATWCAPCIERFPEMVRLQREFSDHGVEFVSLCLDDFEDELAVSRAYRFLLEQEATFRNYLMKENIVDAFQKLDLLGIPAVFVYGRDGSLRYRLTGDDPNDQFTDEDVKAAVWALLLEK